MKRREPVMTKAALSGALFGALLATTWLAWERSASASGRATRPAYTSLAADSDARLALTLARLSHR